MKLPTVAAWVLVGVGISLAGEDPRLESRKRAREEAVQRAGIERALSKEMPEAIEILPSFGAIDWKVKEMPWIEPGPHAGVSGMGMVVVDGQIYLMGGFIPPGDETDLPSRRTSRWAHQYDPQSDRWTKLPHLPRRREYTRAIAAGNDVYVLGGGVQKPRQGLSYRPCADVFRLDTLRKPLRWETVAELSVPRTHMAVGRVGNHLIVVGGNRYDYADGGYSARTIQGVTEVLDLTDPQRGWTRRTPIPGSPRGWCASASVNGKLYVLGGLTFAPSDEGTRGAKIKLRESLSYDPALDRWTRLADPPVAISGWEGAVIGKRYIIVVGGVSNYWSDLALVYDTKHDRWMRVENSLPTGGVLNDAGVSIIGETIYVAGGEGPGGSHFNHLLIGRVEPSAKADSR
jgi:N-acetylneuraminic acid mutarotase